jgi:OTU domain-containing protein 6
VVFSADAPELVTGTEYEANGPRLKLAYHRHYYGLGEHYNSLVPIH